jgi:hypothetical protein
MSIFVIDPTPISALLGASSRSARPIDDFKLLDIAGIDLQLQSCIGWQRALY